VYSKFRLAMLHSLALRSKRTHGAFTRNTHHLYTLQDTFGLRCCIEDEQRICAPSTVHATHANPRPLTCHSSHTTRRTVPISAQNCLVHTAHARNHTQHQQHGMAASPQYSIPSPHSDISRICVPNLVLHQYVSRAVEAVPVLVV